jgi:hypothetical protein
LVEGAELGTAEMSVTHAPKRPFFNLRGNVHRST